MNQGQHWETIACRYLMRQGLVLVERNYRQRWGEIDLIMWDQTELVFVEVKFRSSTRFGSPLEAVTYQKQRKIRLTAQIYLQRFRVMPTVRFDVVGLVPTAKGSSVQIKWVKGAFE